MCGDEDEPITEFPTRHAAQNGHACEVVSAVRPSVSVAELDRWCRSLLGSGVDAVVFESGYSSAVFGVDLVSGRRVVVKARPWSPRLIACTEVQRRLSANGFHCPEPLCGPDELNGLAISLEEFVEGEPLADSGTGAVVLAEVLAELISRAPAASEVPPLPPPYGFLQWPKLPHDRLWPPTPEIGVDLNDSVGVAWIDDLAVRVALRLQVDLPQVVGHGDWWSVNIRWCQGVLASVDDWDSAVSLPEPALVGAAAALFADGESSVEQSETFLGAYAAATGRVQDRASLEVAWAAGLWARLVDAKKWIAVGTTVNPEALRAQVSERAQRAGFAM